MLFIIFNNCIKAFLKNFKLQKTLNPTLTSTLAILKTQLIIMVCGESIWWNIINPYLRIIILKI